MELNNREISILLWIFILLIYVTYSNPNILKNFRRTILDFLSLQILSPYLGAIFYIGIGIYLFHLLGIWKLDQIKDTILWIFITPLITLLNINKNKFKNHFKDAIKDSLKLSLITEFLFTQYTFSLFIELIFAPFIIILTLLQLKTESTLEYKSLDKFIKSILFFIGLLVIIFTLYEIYLNANNFFSINSLRNLLLPIMLTFWFIPFIYLISIYVVYEHCFGMINRFVNKEIIQASKFDALYYFKADRKGLNRWANHLSMYNFNTNDDIINSIKKLKALQKTERNPPEVDSKMGWSPYKAKDFLIKKDIITNFYTHCYENEWMASSNIKKTDDNFLSNTVNYYITGNETTATKLDFDLNIYSIDHNLEALEYYLDCIKLLYQCSLGTSLPIQITKNILANKNINLTHEHFDISFKKEEWGNSTQGYTLRFSIENRG